MTHRGKPTKGVRAESRVQHLTGVVRQDAVRDRERMHSFDRRLQSYAETPRSCGQISERRESDA